MFPKLKQFQKFSSLNQLRNYHSIVQQRSNGRKLLSIKTSKATNRQISRHNLELLTMAFVPVIPTFIIITKFGPEQTWYFDKFINLKIRFFNLTSKEKIDVEQIYIDQVRREEDKKKIV